MDYSKVVFCMLMRCVAFGLVEAGSQLIMHFILCFILCLGSFCLHVTCVHHFSLCLQGLEKAFEPRKLELQTVVRLCVGAGNLVFWKGNQCS